MSTIDYCTDCGNTGWLEPGVPCKCGKANKNVYNESDNLSIPEQYRNIIFNGNRVNKDVGDGYTYYLEGLFNDIVSGKPMNINIFIGSPPKHSKTIFAYSCLVKLYKCGKKVFPLFDTGEIKRIMSDLENGKKCPLLDGLDVNITALLDSPYLFVKVTDELSFDTYNTMVVLLDRRTRRGGNTIFLYNGSWNYFAGADKQGRVKALVGDGTFGTILPKSYWIREDEEENDG